MEDKVKDTNKRNLSEELLHFSMGQNFDIEGLNAVLKSFSNGGSTSTKAIKDALKDTSKQKNISTLQKAMANYKHTNGILKQFIYYLSNILTNDFYIVPTDMTKFKSKEEMWKKEMEVAKYLELFDIKKNFSWIMEEILTYGEVYIYKEETKDSVLLVKIPQDLCVIIGKTSDMQNRYGVDISKISKETITFFPSEIQDAVTRREKGTLKKEELIENKYYKVSDNGVAFTLDEWASKGVPYFSHILDGLITLDDMMALDNVNAVLDNFKLLHQEVPLDEDFESGLESGEVLDYHMNLKSVVPSGIGVVTSPLKIDAVTLGDNKLKKLDYTNKIKKDIYDNAGFNDDLFNGDKSSNEAILMGSVIDTLVPIKIQNALASWLNSVLKQNSKTKFWKVVFCQATEYNRIKLIQNERENLAVYGSKKKYLALQGYTPLEALNIILNEELLGIGEKMQPMQTSHTLSSKGRTPKSDDPSADGQTGEDES